MPKIGDLISALKEAGHFAVRTHLEPLGVKTTATGRELEDLIRRITAS